MAGTYQSGSNEEIVWAEVTNETDLVPAANGIVIPHAGNPGTPSPRFNRSASDVVVSDGQVIDNTATGYTVPMTASAPIAYGQYDRPITSLMGNDWTAGVDIQVAGATATAASNSIQGAINEFTALATQVPCLVYVRTASAGNTAGFNDKMVLALQVTNGGGNTDDTLVFGNATNGGAAIVDDGAAAWRIFHSGRVNNGTDCRFGIIERRQTSISRFYHGFGTLATQLDFSHVKGQEPTWAMTFASYLANHATATVVPTLDPTPTYGAFNAGGNFGEFRENGTELAGILVRQNNFTYSAAASPVEVSGNDGPSGHTRGRFTASGNLIVIAAQAADGMQNRVLNDLPSSLQWWNRRTETVAGNPVDVAYGHWIPSIQYDSHEFQNGGNDNTVENSYPWNARKSPDYGITAQIVRFENIPTTV